LGFLFVGHWNFIFVGTSDSACESSFWAKIENLSAGVVGASLLGFFSFFLL